jgi:hypothetical protein
MTVNKPATRETKSGKPRAARPADKIPWQDFAVSWTSVPDREFEVLLEGHQDLRLSVEVEVRNAWLGCQEARRSRVEGRIDGRLDEAERARATQELEMGITALRNAPGLVEFRRDRYQFRFSSSLASPSELGHTFPEGVTTESQEVTGTQKILEDAQRTFDGLIETLAEERKRQAAQLQPVLRVLLHAWDEEQQRLTRERRDRSADEVAKAKKDIVEYINRALERLDLSIYRDREPCNLNFYVNESNRRGQFWLTPKGSSKPVGQKANLSGLFDLSAGEPLLGLAPPRREGWRHAVEKRRTGPRSKELDR